jgi:hypothetical protein
MFEGKKIPTMKINRLLNEKWKNKSFQKNILKKTSEPFQT